MLVSPEIKAKEMLRILKNVPQISLLGKESPSIRPICWINLLGEHQILLFILQGCLKVLTDVRALLRQVLYIHLVRGSPCLKEFMIKRERVGGVNRPRENHGISLSKLLLPGLAIEPVSRLVVQCPVQWPT